MMQSEREKPSGTLINAVRKACDTAAGEVLGIKKSERVLIITNPSTDVLTLAHELYAAARDRGADTVLAMQEEKSLLDFADKAVLAAIESEPEVIILVNSRKLGKDRRAIQTPYRHAGREYDSIFHYLLFGKRSIRSFWSPGITLGMFAKTVPIDYRRLRDDCSRIKGIFDRAETLHISTEKGTELSVGIRNRTALSDDGNFTTPGSGGNLPAGETFISPALGTTHGSIVYDGSLSVTDGVIMIQNPVRVKVAQGFVTEISGGDEADIFKQSIRRAEQRAAQMGREGLLSGGKAERYAQNASNIGEIGIGLNPKAEICGSMLEDEKAFQTCHIAVGSNYDEDAPSLIHLDGLITKPTITASFPDGTEAVLLEKGTAVPEGGGG
jgi:hypothetical protein